MGEVALRALVALAGGAMARMLVVFGLASTPVAMATLAVVAGVMGHRLATARILTVVGPSLGYFAAWLFTQSPPPQGSENPEAWALVKNGAEVFLPFVTPPIGALISLKLEKHVAANPAKLDEEITEESLLAESIPEPNQAWMELKDLED